MIVTVNPELRLKLVDDSTEIRSEGWSKRAALVPRLDRIWVRRVVRDHHCWAAEWYRQLLPNECQIQPMLRGSVPRHEAAEMAARFLIAYQAVIVQRFSGIDHRGFRGPVQPIVGPEHASDEPHATDHNGVSR